MLLVERGFFPTRAKAQAAIMAGKVAVEGCPNPKAGSNLARETRIDVLADAMPYVSRGGLKLAAAIERFTIPVAGRTALDVGASTGGFTDCLLQRGARKVYAVDVGHGQLDARLRTDARVVCLERTHARALSPELFRDAPPDLAVIDVAFISLTKVLPFVLPCLIGARELVALIKPQFELEPKKVPKGVVRKEEFRREAVEKVRAAARELPVTECGLMESPLRGPKGNVEFLWFARAQPPAGRG